MNEEIKKPITVVRQDFIDEISNIINNSGLPLFVVEPILKDIYLEVKSLMQKQYELEKAEYQQQMQKCNKEANIQNDANDLDK